MPLQDLSFIQLVHDDLEEVERLLSQPVEGRHAAIGMAMDHLIGSGGKRLRPVLVLLSAHLCGAPMEQVVYAAAAVEMLHTATLIHDDLIDGALMRRGLETLNARWSPATTVLTGDYVFAYAAHLAAQAENIRLMQRFSETLMVICNGEIRQMFSHRQGYGRPGKATNRQEYNKRIYAKTASLIAMSSEAGAILADAAEETIRALRTYGEKLGLAFQIVDDVLDLVADETTLGKPVGSDLRHGLITLPVLFFLESETEPNRSIVEEVLAKPASPEAMIQEAVRIVAGSPAVEQAMEVARQYAAQAKAFLDSQPDSPYRTALIELADFTVRRRL